MTNERASGTTAEGWLTLQTACQLVGVSPSTLRRWADAGRLVTQRTAGGHRRFAVASVQQLAANHVISSGPGRPGTSATSVSDQSWHARLAQAPVAEQMRGLGQRLLGLLIQYLVWPGDDRRFLADSRTIGERYGAVARQAGISLSETINAFLYFRRSVWRMALELPSVAQTTDAQAIVRIAERIDLFMDGVLLSAIASYEQPNRAATEPALAPVIPD